jgi:hypothetical protein
VAGSSKLSNHSFGLAIDIDNLENPRIYDPKGHFIPLLNEVVKRKCGLDYDFASLFVEGLGNSRVLSNRQHLLLAYGSAKKASDAVQAWLKENLAAYDARLSEISHARGTKPGTPAFIKGQQAQQAIDNERDLQLVKLLRHQIEEDVLESWAQTGIVNLPIELIAAFYVAFNWNPLFRWGGGDYCNSKDFMHFELQAVITEGGRVRPGALTPDSKQRTLEELFPAAFLDSYFEVFKLAAEVADMATIPIPHLVTATPSLRAAR